MPETIQTLKKRVQQLEKENRHLSNIIDLIPANVYWKDAQGRMLGCNMQMLENLGLKSYSEYLGKTDSALVGKKEGKKTAKIDRVVMQSRKPKIVEEIVVFPPGKKTIYLSSKAPVFDEDNNVIGIIGVSHDITEQRQLEKELKLAKEKLELAEQTRKDLFSQMTREVTGQLLDSSKHSEDYVQYLRYYLENIINCIPIAIYWKNRDGIYLGCNDYFLKTHQIPSRNSYIGKTCEQQLLNKKVAKAVGRTDEEIMSTDREKILEEENILPDGTVITYLTHKVPLHDSEGNVVGLLGVSLDITQQKATERALEQARLTIKLQEERINMLQLFGTSIAHELRTPLMSIFNHASSQNFLSDLIEGYELAKKAKLPVKFIRSDQLNYIHDVFDQIQLNVHRINDFIDTILTNIKGFSGHIAKDHFKSCTALACVESALNHFLTLYPEEESLFEREQKPQDFSFKGDPLLIEHLLFNLIKNAVHYIHAAKKGQISIHLEPGNDYNRLYFQDTGQGIPEDILPHIFEAFFSRRKYGTGVGLAFCQWAIETIGGKITCESKIGEFTKFTLLFPTI